ncbi:tRNA glutamyl-Q(34) synthetase GluQRS [uncultured Sphingomonas sp.]|uniref:tRNA glutamyl-Q(34) synthetase GluQRS n=1 Tax=uncultured Sphingomonas sp. TaxID=158754 RepID=UPI0035CBC852
MMTAQPATRGQGPYRRISTRFAPSPTGPLHLGHAWSAICAHDRAARDGGAFLVRIEDIDKTRSRVAFVAAILDELRWLGLEWAEPIVFQSARVALYDAALARLHENGWLYPCFCTRADIAAAGSAPHGPGGAIYPGTCRALSPDERAARMTSPHAWRIDVVRAAAAAGRLDWVDEIAGDQRADPVANGDVVLARKDASASYHLAVTVDDADQGISHVVRGRDLFAATGVQVLLQALLGLPTPTYRHHALMVDARGERLAKRAGAPALADLRRAFPDGRILADRLRRGELPIGFGLVSD